MNIGIWVFGALHQLLIRGSYTQFKLKKKEKISGKIMLTYLCDRSILYSFCSFV